jgi:aldehyde reductase
MKKTVTFPNGLEMPIVGYGMWQSLNPEELEKALDAALEAGYRHFDTAFTYDNEVIFGNVLKRWFDSGMVKREELFIVTKLPVFGSHHERVEPFLKLSLERLQLDYVDLYLIHQPAGIKVDETGLKALKVDGKVVPDTTSTIEDIWKAMEAQVPTGRAKSIGLSNFSVKQIERVAKIATIMPANHQVELNAYYPKKNIREVGAKYGITTCAFAPLGSPGRKESYKNEANAHLRVQIPPLLEDPTVNEIAKKHNRPASQILLRFLAQQEIVVIPKSVTPERIKSNFQIFDLELDAEDMAKLDALDTGKEGTWGFDWENGAPGISAHPEFELPGVVEA